MLSTPSNKNNTCTHLRFSVMPKGIPPNVSGGSRRSQRDSEENRRNSGPGQYVLAGARFSRMGRAANCEANACRSSPRLTCTTERRLSPVRNQDGARECPTNPMTSHHDRFSVSLAPRSCRPARGASARTVPARIAMGSQKRAKSARVLPSLSQKCGNCLVAVSAVTRKGDSRRPRRGIA